MIIVCAPFQNLVSDLQSWNEEAKACEEVKEHLCINLIKHREPKVFDEEEHWKAHVTKSYKHRFEMPRAGPGGRGRHRKEPLGDKDGGASSSGKD